MGAGFGRSCSDSGRAGQKFPGHHKSMAKPSQTIRDGWEDVCTFADQNGSYGRFHTECVLIGIDVRSMRKTRTLHGTAIYAYIDPQNPMECLGKCLLGQTGQWVTNPSGLAVAASLRRLGDRKGGATGGSSNELLCSAGRRWIWHILRDYLVLEAS